MSNFTTEIHKTRQMEQYNIAYVHALVSCCGWKLIEERVDDDGVDILIKGAFKAENGKVARPMIEVQLKSTKNLEFTDDHVKYVLEAKNYNKLCEEYTTPRYLFVLDLDGDPMNWISEENSSLVLSKKCYWFSLEGAGTTTNKKNVTISIPSCQVLTRESLNEIMKKSALGGEL